MKTEDSYFRGFPALWNVVALYLYAAQVDPVVAAAIVSALIILTFAPIHFVHPFRVEDFGKWLPGLAIVWAVATLALLFGLPPEIRPVLLAVSALSAMAIVASGLLRTLRGPSADSISSVSSPKDSGD